MIDFVNIGQLIIKAIADEWTAQGHDLTEKFREGMRATVDGDDDKIIKIIDTTGSGYGKILDDGVKATQIKSPFAPPRIKGLTEYTKLRMGASDKDAISIAYAIAYKHSKEGMPLPSSKKYSKTGQRTKFVDAAKKKIDEIVKENIKIQWQLP